MQISSTCLLARPFPSAIFSQCKIKLPTPWPDLSLQSLLTIDVRVSALKIPVTAITMGFFRVSVHAITLCYSTDVGNQCDIGNHQLSGSSDPSNIVVPPVSIPFSCSAAAHRWSISSFVYHIVRLQLLLKFK